MGERLAELCAKVLKKTPTELPKPLLRLHRYVFQMLRRLN